MEILLIVFAVIALLILLILVMHIKEVKQTDKYVIQRFGLYKTTWSGGWHVLTPFLDKVAKVVSIKEQVVDFEPQPVITKDNVTMQIDTVVFFQITDPKLFTYGVDRPLKAIENLTATTLRNIIGELELDSTLTSRDIINTRMRATLDEATDPWGIKVNRVEVKNIMPPKDIRDAMEKQMRAERERRESILRAEGEKTAAILTAEGAKESAILNAEAEKEYSIRIAEGQAKSIIMVQEAEAAAIKLINEANASKEYLALKSLEAYSKIADGKATKIVVPTEMQSIASLLTTAKEMLSSDKK